GFSFGTLVVATLLLEKNTLAIILTIIAGVAVYILRRPVKRNRGLLIGIVVIWFICVGVQRFGVPFIFKHVLQKHQIERIYSTIGKDVPTEYINASFLAEEPAGSARTNTADYNVKQSKIAIGSGRIFGKGLLKGTQT